MSKLNIQEIAKAIGVSRVSVWKALNNKPGVSDAVRKKIIEKAREIDSSILLNKNLKEKTFSIVVSRPESSAFWMQIIHHIAKELAKYNINLMYTYMPSAFRKNFTLPATLEKTSIDGFIVLNVYDKNIVDMLSNIDLPKVFFDTRPEMDIQELKGDILLLEGKESINKITQKLIDMDIKNIGFIGDVTYAKTNLDRYEGFVKAHKIKNISVKKELCMLNPISLRSHYEEISLFFNKLQTMPDAIVCVSDFIAHFVKRYIDENNIKKDIILTGFDNSTEYSNISNCITSVDVQMPMLGRRLARKLMLRCDYPDSSYELSYVSTNVIYRDKLEV